MRFRKSSVLIAAASALTLGSLMGCSPADDASGNSTAGASEGSSHAPLLNLGMVDAPGQGGLVAANMSFSTKAPYGQAVYDTLVRATPTNELQPSLATEWTYDDTNTVLTLKLRDDVSFTDGTKFDASVAAQNVLRFRDGSAENANWLAGVTDAKAVDAATLQITLSAPDPSLLVNLSRAAGYQESPASFDDPNPIGTGPYVLDAARTVTDSKYVFTANKDYWAPEYQHYDEVDMTVFDDSVSMQNALLGGQLNAALYAGDDGFDQIKGAGYTAHEYSNDWQGLLLFDRAGDLSPAMGDVRVRQAINYAVDKAGILKGLSGGRGDLTTQVFGPDTPGFDADLDDAYPYDPDKARALLAEAGYADGVEITFPTVSFVPPATFDLVGQQLAEVGITANFVDVAPQAYVGSLLSGSYPIAAFRLEQPGSEWATYNLVAAQNAPWNPMHQPDEKVAAWGQTIQTGTPEESAKAASELNAYLVDQAWFDPWFRNITTFFTDASTDVTVQVGNSFPYLWNITPKS